MATKSIQSLLQDIRLLGETNHDIAQGVRPRVNETFDATSENVKSVADIKRRRLAEYLFLAHRPGANRKKATRPGLAIRAIFLSGRAWHPVVAPCLTRKLSTA